ncbi:MAG: type II toxin-antitoxin system RelE/ParE family toxin [Candidatus Acidiferrales bacterium]
MASTPGGPQRWEVEGTDQFIAWYRGLSEPLSHAVDAAVELLERFGPSLARPYADTLKQSRHANMKELRVRYRGDAYRVLFAFDTRRTAILLLGGRKADSKWYEKAVAQADKLYDEHLEELKREGLL